MNGPLLYKPLRRQYRLGQHGVDRELGHPASHLGEFTHVVEGAEGVQLLQRQHQRLVRRRIHEIKVNQVVDAQGLQQQHYVP